MENFKKKMENFSKILSTGGEIFEQVLGKINGNKSELLTVSADCLAEYWLAECLYC